MTNAKKVNRPETGPETTVDNRVPADTRPADQKQADTTRADAMPVEPRSADQKQAERHAEPRQVEPTHADTRQVRPPEGESKSAADTSRGPLAAPGATGAPDRVTAGRHPGSAGHETGLIGGDDVERYRNDWRSVQSGFVDDPAGSVREADALVGRLFDTITSRIAQQRSALAQRRPDESADRTEQLRLALRDYRTMFEQLLPG